MKITIKNARLSFPDLFQPRPYEAGGKPKYKATFLVPKGSEQAKEIEAAILKTAQEKWGAKAGDVLKTIRNNPNRYCYQDGETKTYDGYEGMMAFSASNAARPTVIDRDRSPLAEGDGRPYAGCYVNAIVSLWAQNNNYGKRINAQLDGVQFCRDGDPFGDGAVSVNEFDAFGSESDEDFDF